MAQEVNGDVLVQADRAQLRARRRIIDVPLRARHTAHEPDGRLSRSLAQPLRLSASALISGNDVIINFHETDIWYFAVLLKNLQKVRSGAFERLLCQNAIVETFPCVLGSVGVRDDCMAWGMEEALYMIVNAATARSDRKFSTRRGFSHSQT